MKLELTVNGAARRLDDVWAGESLLYVLRERLGLPGSKNACEQGECGSCSVYLDDSLVCACLVLAGQAEQCHVRTVESLSAEDGLDALQTAFVDAGAVQCGFCTPGFLMAAKSLLEQTADPTELEIREALSGNTCRCTGYTKIFAAVQRVAASGRDDAT